MVRLYRRRAVSAVGDAGAKLAVFERDADGVTRRHTGGVADDPRSVVVPAHRITAAQHGQRTQPIEARGRVAESGLAAVQSPSGDRVQARILSQERRPDSSQAMARIELAEGAVHPIEATAPVREMVSPGMPQRAGEVTEVTRSPGQAPGKSGEARTRQQGVEASLLPAQAIRRRAAQLLGEPADVGDELVLLPDHDLGGC